jgi:hypothetical protein
MNAPLELVVEEEEDSMGFVDLYEDLESLERRVMVKIFHIQ